jgi:hypothetical protein
MLITCQTDGVFSLTNTLQNDDAPENTSAPIQIIIIIKPLKFQIPGSLALNFENPKTFFF